MKLLNRLINSPFIMSPEGETSEGGGGGGEAPPAKSFSQDEVNGMLKRERVATEARFAQFETLKTQAGEREGLAAKVLELEQAAEIKNASEAEQATIMAQRAADQHQVKLEGLTKDIADMKAGREAAESQLVDFRNRTSVQQSLAKSGVLVTAGKHALTAMMADAEITLADDGSIATIMLDGVMQADLDTATAQFLTDNPHFKSAPAGGSGTQTPNGVKAGDRPLLEQSDGELWAKRNPR